VAYCKELSRVPEYTATVEFLVRVPGSGQSEAEPKIKEADCEQPDPEEADSKYAEGVELPPFEELTALLSLIQSVSGIAVERCDYFNRRPTGFFSSLTTASTTIVRERRYVLMLLAATVPTRLKFLKAEGPVLPVPVDPDELEFSLGG